MPGYGTVPVCTAGDKLRPSWNKAWRGGKSFETIFGTFKKFARTERVSSASREDY
jgi:hypothetical protein